MKSTKRAVTLIEMMVVMFLIALILGVVAYNYRGTLEEGKAFKTKAGMERLETILNLAISDNPTLTNTITNNWEEVVQNSPLVKDPNALIYDGWGGKYQVELKNGMIEVSSQNYLEYQKSKK